MADDKFYARIGRLVVMLDQEREDHRRTYALLKSIVEGKVSVERVKIIDGGWELLPEEKDG